MKVQTFLVADLAIECHSFMDGKKENKSSRSDEIEAFQKDKRMQCKGLLWAWKWGVVVPCGATPLPFGLSNEGPRETPPCVA